jgi:hypothetical protein
MKKKMKNNFASNEAIIFFLGCSDFCGSVGKGKQTKFHFRPHNASILHEALFGFSRIVGLQLYWCDVWNTRKICINTMTVFDVISSNISRVIT